ncbi:MAG: DMT family transporter [Phycisphaerales bacterium]|nr:DMT family transporter [Phycisphaerales bacterium]
MTQPVAPLPLRLSVASADGLLLLCAVLWGIGFVAQRIATQQMGDTPFTFNAARFLIGAVILLPFVIRRGEARTLTTLVGGVAASIALLTAASLQQKAMATVTAGTAGFITGTYVLWVPLLGLLLGQRVLARVWVGVALTIVGLWFLVIRDTVEVQSDDLYLMGCALAWACHVHVIGWAVRRGDPLGIAVVQFAVTGVLSAVIALSIEPVSVDLLCAGWGSILFSALFAIAIAFTLQALAQTSAPPSHAAVILSLEALFAEISGSLWMNESFDPRKWFGALLMLGGALVATVTGFRRPLRESVRPQPPAAD